MSIFHPTHPACSNCQADLEGNEEVCPYCGFHPRNEGLKWAGVLLLVVVILYTATIFLAQWDPFIAAYVMVGVFICFFLSFIAFVISFLATPYRFGSLFT